MTKRWSFSKVDLRQQKHGVTIWICWIWNILRQIGMATKFALKKVQVWVDFCRKMYIRFHCRFNFGSERFYFRRKRLA